MTRLYVPILFVGFTYVYMYVVTRWFAIAVAPRKLAVSPRLGGYAGHRHPPVGVYRIWNLVALPVIACIAEIMPITAFARGSGDDNGLYWTCAVLEILACTAWSTYLAAMAVRLHLRRSA